MSGYTERFTGWWESATGGQQLAVTLTGFVVLTAGVTSITMLCLPLLTGGAVTAGALGAISGARSLRRDGSGSVDVCKGLTFAGQQSPSGDFVGIAYNGDDDPVAVAQQVASTITSSNGGTTAVTHSPSGGSLALGQLGDDDVQATCLGQDVSIGEKRVGNGGEAISVYTRGVAIQTLEGAGANIVVDGEKLDNACKSVANTIQPTPSPLPSGKGADNGSNTGGLVFAALSAGCGLAVNCLSGVIDAKRVRLAGDADADADADACSDGGGEYRSL